MMTLLPALHLHPFDDLHDGFGNDIDSLAFKSDDPQGHPGIMTSSASDLGTIWTDVGTAKRTNLVPVFPSIANR